MKHDLGHEFQEFDDDKLVPENMYKLMLTKRDEAIEQAMVPWLELNMMERGKILAFMTLARTLNPADLGRKELNLLSDLGHLGLRELLYQAEMRMREKHGLPVNIDPYTEEELVEVEKENEEHIKDADKHLNELAQILGKALKKNKNKSDKTEEPKEGEKFSNVLDAMLANNPRFRKEGGIG